MNATRIRPFQEVDSKLTIKLCISVFVFFFALFALTNNGADLSEGNYHYLVAQQIVRYGRLDLDSVPPSSVFSVAPNGKFYGSHEIGNTLFMIPTAFFNDLLVNAGAAIGRKILPYESGNIASLPTFIFSFQSSVYSAITATTFFALLRTRFSLTILYSFIAAVSLATTTFFWNHSRNLFDGVLCATILTLSFFFLSNYSLNKKKSYLIAAFVCLGFALITRISVLFAIVASFIYLISLKSPLKERFRNSAIALSTLLPFVLWQGWYNHLRTGSPFMSPVQSAKYAVNNALDGNLIVGVLGYLMSPGKSIFVHAPLLILSVLLFKKFYKRYKPEALYTIALFVFWLLLHSRMRSWYGSWGWGPRLFITILPILFLPFAVNLETVLKQARYRIAAIVLGIFGFALAFSSMISSFLIRIDYAIQQNRFDDAQFVWSIWNNQAVDMLKAGAANVYRILTRSTSAPLPIQAKKFPEWIDRAANTANFWLFHATKLPFPLRLAGAVFLVVLMGVALRFILQQHRVSQRLSSIVHE